MFDFFIRNFAVQGAQKFIDGLEPKVAIHIPPDLPLPSISTIKRMAKTVAQINGLEAKIEKLSAEELRAKTQEFKAKYQAAIKDMAEELRKADEDINSTMTPEERESASLALTKSKEDFKRLRQNALNEILPEAFAAVREASKRTIGLRHFDVQMAGGMVLHEGKIAEMATGEGKTLVCTLPAYLNAITGYGVHVVTVNDYLAHRDREWMGPIYEYLGLTVGVILHDMDPRTRQTQYACDITFGTNNEFGFDYLRDNMVIFKEEMVQPYHNFAIVDEVDSILIDEARTPLIISGPAEESTDKYYRANEISLKLKGRRTTENEEVEAKYRNEDLTVGFDYIANEKNRSISLTEQGEEKAAKMFGVANIHDMDTIEYRHHVLQALKSKEFFKRDVDYVVRDGGVIIVDEFTGRLMPGRRWSDGLHQATEAKEGIKIERENQTLATITLQNYFRMYDKLAGMTGTAHTEANEFQQIYKLECIVIPSNRPLSRLNHADCIYKTVREKYTAVVQEIEEFHKRGQPVLVGTISIEKSETLSAMLKQKGIPHQVLNAKYHELEAQIVAQAGRYKGVTIATNMAGRGTDIVLGGNPEFLARSLADQKADKNADPAQKNELIQKFLQQFREQTKKEHEQVVAVGGLHVLGTERHESRRIDNQLRGRSGRQGDPGSSRFYVSLEDDLMRLFASDRIKSIMDRLGMEEGQVIEHPWVSRALEIAQKRVENYNFEIRKQLLEYDNVMNKQREAIYGLRRYILESSDVKGRVLDAIEDTVALMVDQYFVPTENSEWDVEGFIVNLKTKFNLDVSSQRDKLKDMDKEEVRKFTLDGVFAVYEHKEKEISPEHLRQLEKMMLLNTIDAKWKDHLYAMDQLKEGVGLRSYGQRDPLIEYKREGFQMFQIMYATINEEVVETLFKVQAVTGTEPMRGVFSSLPQQLVHNDFSTLGSGRGPLPGVSSALMEDGEDRSESAPASKPIQNSGPKVGRNDPCPCGSGKKYKKCCGQNA